MEAHRIMRRTTFPGHLAALFVIAAILLLGCGGDDATGPGGDPSGSSNNAPTVTIVYPVENSTVSGAVSLGAVAGNAALVRFDVDGVEVGSDDTSPYEVIWNSGTVPNGVHSIGVQATGGGKSAWGGITVTVANTPGVVVITVSPSSAEVAAGATAQFSAVVTGTSDTGVTWSVDGGGAWGVVGPGGLYTAPSIVPDPPVALVRATSTADPSKSAAAEVSLTPGDGTGGGGEAEIGGGLFSVATEAVTLVEDAVQTVLSGAWQATAMNGGQVTLTGTLTQVSAGSDQFTYSPSPADRLVVVFFGQSPIEFQISSIDGYTDGDLDDFLDGHDVTFTAFSSGVVDLQIYSRKVAGADDYTRDWTRAVSGTAVYRDGNTVRLDLTDHVTVRNESSSSVALSNYDETTTGTASIDGLSITVNEKYHSEQAHNSSTQQHVANYGFWSANSADVLGSTYFFTGGGGEGYAEVQWETFTQFSGGSVDSTHLNVVSQPNDWIAAGGLVKDGRVIGVLDFSGPVDVGTWGPDLILRVEGEEPVMVHTLIDMP